jgi:uncharacterized repeat protein (TIGR02543 family)
MYYQPDVAPYWFARYEFDQSRTLYAFWKKNADNSYTVIFNANGGTGTMAVQTAKGATPLTPNAFTRTGYDFDGWSVGDTANEYADGASYPFTADVNLNAEWTCKPFTITVTASRIGVKLRKVEFSANSELPMTSFTVTTKFGTFPQTVTTTSNSGSFDYTNLPNNKTYKYVVTGTNAAGCSSSAQTQSAV